MSDSEIKESLELIAGMMPKNPKITDGYAKEGRAVLYVEGTLEGEKQYGTVELAKKGQCVGDSKRKLEQLTP